MFGFSRIPSVRWDEIKRDDVLIDVREASEYRCFKVPHSKNIPLSMLSSFQTNEKVFVFCASGVRSKRAVKELRKKGIDAVNIKGGLMTYEK